MIDTHAHIYLEEFDEDRDEVILRAKEKGIEKIVLPNIDSSTLQRTFQLADQYQGFCHAAIGLHPESVKENFDEELSLIESHLEKRKFVAIGEIGIDLYWDKTFESQQIDAFKRQIEWAVELKLPIIIHVRNSFGQVMQVLKSLRNRHLTGVFHSFTGNLEEANEIIRLGGFKIGINGILTFKNSHLRETVSQINLENIILETDAPYLTPVPYRGKRNESAFLYYTCEKLAEVYGTTMEEVDLITSQNARDLFKFPS
jgi:TatD DNase family protein